MDRTLILLGSGSLVCLMPVALYLLYLAHLNSRTQPTFVPGPWDFGTLLLGLSGFLILAGPLILTIVDSVWRSYAFGNWAELKGVGRKEAVVGSILATIYFLLLAFAIFIMLRSRRSVTAVYNVAASDIESTLVGVLDELGYIWRRDRGRILIGLNKPTDVADFAAAFVPQETATVRLDSFPFACHATMRWGGASAGVRREVEEALPRALMSPTRNPMGGWMFTAAIAVMVIMLLWLIALVVVIVFPPPG